MKRFILFVTITLVILMILLVLSRSERYFFLYPDIDTVYASGFSYAKFSKIQVGMSKEQVRQLLGSPFIPFSHDNRTECWPYSQDGRLWPVGDFAWIFVRVCFEDGMVAGTYRDVFGD